MVTFHLKRCEAVGPVVDHEYSETIAPSVTPCISNHTDLQAAIEDAVGGTHFICPETTVEIEETLIIAPNSSSTFECAGKDCAITTAVILAGDMFRTTGSYGTMSNHTLSFKNIVFKNGTGSGRLVRLHGGRTSFAGDDCVIKGNNFTQGTFFVENGSLAFDNCLIQNNEMRGAPAMVFNVRKSVMTITNSRVLNNTLVANDLLHIHDGSSVQLSFTEIVGNTVHDDLIEGYLESNITMHGVKLSGNECDRVIRSHAGSSWALQDVEISDNAAIRERYTDLVQIIEQTTMDLRNVTFLSNKAEDDLVQAGIGSSGTDGSSLSMFGVQFVNNTANNGRMLSITGSASVNLTNGEILNNTIKTDIVHVRAASVVIQNVTFVANDCEDVFESFLGAQWDVSDVEIVENECEDDIIDHQDEGGLMRLTRVKFLRNVRHEDLIQVGNNATAFLEDVAFIENESEEELVNVFRDGSTLYMTKSKILNNTARNIVKITAKNTSAILQDVQVIDNTSKNALIELRNAATLTMNQSEIVGNLVENNSRGIAHVVDSSDARFNGCLFKGNTAATDLLTVSTSTASCDAQTAFCNGSSEISGEATGCGNNANDSRC